MVERRLIAQEKGIVGINRSFKKVISEASLKEEQIAFIGSPSVCLPVAELLAYAVRDLNFHACFIPNAVKEKARSLVYAEGYGFQLGEKASPKKAKVFVICGGVAMPGSPVQPEDVDRLREEILEKDGLVIGIGFMGVFDRANWTEKVRFDYVIDSTIDPVTTESFSR